MTAQNLEAFTTLVATASSQLLKDEANRRLRSAQDYDDSPTTAMPEQPSQASTADTTISPVQEETGADNGIITTDEEIEGYSIIRAICCSEVPATDVVIRDAKSYCAILYKDNNRKPIARLYFDRKTPRIGIFDADKKEHMHDLNVVADIYGFADELRARVKSFL